MERGRKSKKVAARRRGTRTRLSSGERDSQCVASNEDQSIGYWAQASARQACVCVIVTRTECGLDCVALRISVAFVLRWLRACVCACKHAWVQACVCVCAGAKRGREVGLGIQRQAGATRRPKEKNATLTHSAQAQSQGKRKKYLARRTPRRRRRRQPAATVAAAAQPQVLFDFALPPFYRSKCESFRLLFVVPLVLDKSGLNVCQSQRMRLETDATMSEAIRRQHPETLQ